MAHGPGGGTPGVGGVFSAQAFASLAVRDFRWLWLSSMAGFLAMQMDQVARGWLVYRLTSSPMALAWVMVSFSAPMTLFSLLGGAVTDRVSKRAVLGLTMAASAAITLAIALLIHLGQIAFWHLVVSGFFSGLVIAFQMPGRYSFIPRLVGEGRVVNATALVNTGMNLTRVGAPAAAGLLIAWIGEAGVFDLMAASYALGALAVLAVRDPGRPAGRSGHTIAFDVKEGLAYVWRNSAVMGLLAMGLASMLFGFPYMMLLPAFAVEALALGPEGFGVLLAIAGVGAIGGSLAVAYLGNIRRMGLLFLGSALVWGGALAGFAVSPSLLVAAAPLAVTGAASAVYGSVNLSMVQLKTAPEMRGRVMSIFMWTFGLMPLGLLPVSAVAEAVGTPAAFLGCGLLLAAATLALYALLPAMRNLSAQVVAGEGDLPHGPPGGDGVPSGGARGV